MGALAVQLEDLSKQLEEIKKALAANQSGEKK